MASISLQKVWLITGTSSGLGQELVRSAMSRGDKVIATARSLKNLKDIQASHPKQCHALQLDVTDTFWNLSAKAKEAMAVWGRVDVLVNNAGHGLFGTIEEAGVEGFMQMYKTNVFGVINVTNACLPYMRHRRSGTVVVIGSRSAWQAPFPTGSLYGSSKAAIHAITDALALELRPQGIRVLNVVPGGLRTRIINNCATIGNINLTHPMQDIETGEVPEYAKLRAAADKQLRVACGAENGNTERAASVIVDVVRGEGVAEGRPFPESLFLGSDALRDVSAKCQVVLRNLEEWEDVARSIDIRP